MGYSKEIYEQAHQILASRRDSAQRMAEERREALERQLPELSVIRQGLAQTGIDAARVALMGGEQAEARIARLKAENQSLQNRRASLLQSMNASVQDLSPRYVCTHCSDTGFQGQTRCSCLEELLRRLAFTRVSESSGLGDCRFENFSLSYYPSDTVSPSGQSPRQNMELIFSACQNYARTFSLKSENLLFLGGTGLGKTHLSLSIARQVIDAGFGVFYISCQRLMDQLQEQQFGRRGGDSEGENYQGLSLECDLLILDDLGAEFSTQFTVSALQHLVNTRIIEHRPTIISTNLDEKLLKERYGERLLSRLFGEYKAFPFHGRDIRFQKRLQKK